MAETGGRYRRSTPVSPINFRMPSPLRSRLRRFAEERSIGEADALRLIVSEHLDEVERDRDLADAERWQLEQVYETLRRRRRGGVRPVPKERVERLFADALAAVRTERPRAKKAT